MLRLNGVKCVVVGGVVALGACLLVAAEWGSPKATEGAGPYPIAFPPQPEFVPQAEVLTFDALVGAPAGLADSEPVGPDSGRRMVGFSFQAQDALPGGLTARWSDEQGEAARELGTYLQSTGLWHRFRLSVPVAPPSGADAESALSIEVKRGGPDEEHYLVDQVFVGDMPWGEALRSDGAPIVAWRDLRSDTVYRIEWATSPSGPWNAVTNLNPEAAEVMETVDLEESTVFYRLAIPSVQVDGEIENGGEGGSTTLSNHVQFGAYTFELPTPAASQGQEGDLHQYAVPDAQFDLQLPHPALSNLMAALDGVQLGFKMNPANPMQFEAVTAHWSGQKTFTVGLLLLTLSEVDLTIDAQGALNAVVNLCAAPAPGDQEVHPNFFLENNLGGCAQVTFLGAVSFSSSNISWNFSGVTNVNIDLRSGAETVARVENATLDPAGRLAADISLVKALRTQIGGTPLVLTNLDLSFALDLTAEQSFVLHDSQGGAYFGEGERSIALAIDYSEVAHAMKLTGAGQFHTQLGQTPLALDLTAFELLYDFRAVRVSAASGTGQLGEGEQRLGLNVSYDPSEEALLLDGAGLYRGRVGGLPLELELIEFLATYDFSEAKVRSVVGMGQLGEGEQRMMVQARYAEETQAVRLTGQGFFSAYIGPTPLQLELTEFAADYNFADLVIVAGAGTGRLGEGADRMDLAVTYDPAAKALALEGTGSFDTKLGGADLELTLTQFRAVTDFMTSRVESASGQAYLGQGDDRLLMTVGYSASEGALALSGNGELRMPVGAAEAVLTLSDLGVLYDFNTVRVTSAAGTGYLGEGVNRMLVDVQYSAEAGALTLAGTGVFHSAIGNANLELHMTDFQAACDFQSVSILSATGTGYLGNGDDRILMNVGYSGVDRAMRLQGTGSLRAALGDTALALDLTAFSVLYDFEQAVVEDAAGTGRLGEGDRRIDLAIGYSSAARAIHLSGTGTFAAVAGTLPLDLTLTEFSAVYDFSIVRVQSASGSGVLGEGDNRLNVAVSYSSLEERILLNGTGALNSSLGDADLALTLNTFQASFDFERVRVLAAQGAGQLGRGDDRIAVKVTYSAPEEALIVSGAGTWSAVMGGADLRMTLSDFTARYDFEQVRVLKALGTGEWGRDDDAIQVTIDHREGQDAIHMTGTGTMTAPLGGGELTLQLDTFEAEYDFQQVAVLDASGSGSYGNGTNRIDLGIAYAAGSQSLSLLGSGSLSCAAAGAELHLDLDTLDMLYDFDQVRVRAVAGSGSYGNGTNRIALAVDYAEAARALRLSGSGGLAASMGRAELALDLTQFDALYDFEQFTLLNIQGQGALGVEASRMAVGVGYSAAEQAMDLTGTGTLQVALGTVDLGLDFSAFHARYDFANVRILEAAGSAQVASGTNRLNLAVSYLEGSRTIGLAGSGHLGFQVGAQSVELELSAFEAAYDFERFDIRNAAGTGAWGSGANYIALDIGYEADAIALAGIGHLEFDGSGFGLVLEATDFAALYDFDAFLVLAFDGWGTLSKGGHELALAQLQLDPAQVLHGQFSVLGEPTFDSNGFDLQIRAFDVAGTLNLTNGALALQSGRADIEAGGIAGMQGSVGLLAAFSPTAIEAGLRGSDEVGLSALGCTLSHPSLSVVMTTDFELVKLEGELDARQAQLNADFRDVSFLVEYGQLVRFTVGDATVDYQGFNFALSSALYQQDVGLSFNTFLAIEGLGDLAVDEFRVTTAGAVSIGSIEGYIDRNPVEVHFLAAFGDRRFLGTFDGTFPPDIDIMGAVEIGAMNDGIADFVFVYLFLDTDLGPTGVPLGPTGLKLSSIAGELGINYDASETVGPPWIGEPARGVHSIGLGLGLGDSAGLAELSGFARLTLGPEATALFVLGELQVTASDPYFYGQMTVNYHFGETRLWGSLSSTLHVPANGAIVNLGPGLIDYQLANNEWFVVGSMDGILFNTTNIQVWGKCNLRGPLSNPIGGMTGMIGAGLDAAMSDQFAYPSNFDPSSCSRAQDTDNWVGFGFKGMYNVYGGGEVMANIYEYGITGYFTVYAGFNGSVMTKWPCGLFGCGDSCVSTYWLTADGRLTAEQNIDNMHVYGYLAFAASGGLSEEAELDFYWDR